ncbi:MAG: hypothetical protein KIS81_10075 [Maricaulaceae bacterium]|nr:hypothetical protein [Maricaulaceae bacterium]
MTRLTAAFALLALAAAPATAQGVPGVYDASNTPGWEFATEQDGARFWFPDGDDAPADGANCNIVTELADISAADFGAETQTWGPGEFGDFLSALDIDVREVLEFGAGWIDDERTLPGMVGGVRIAADGEEFGLISATAISGGHVVTITCATLWPGYQARHQSFTRFIDAVQLYGEGK